MKILLATASNFASYKELRFMFDNQGLCLVQGATGSGKSTLCDLVPWVLFGRTAKDGAADDVVSWNSDERTSASIIIDLGLESVYEISRSRQPNDLYYRSTSYAPHPEHKDMCVLTEAYTRGKDLNDTQKQINQLLGMTYETYMAGSYFHEFSKTASFFTTTAKNRRDICEQLVDLSMAKNLQLKASDELKAAKQQAEKAISLVNQIQGKIDDTEFNKDGAAKAANEFDEVKARRIEAIKHSDDNFDITKQQTLIQLNGALASKESLLDKVSTQLEESKAQLKDDKCNNCGAHMDHKVRHDRTALTHKALALKHEIKGLKQDFEKTINSINPYAAQLLSEETRENTYFDMVDKFDSQLTELEAQLSSAVNDLDTQVNKTADLELLSETLQTFRASLITDTMGFIQDKTNSLLSDYFDGEIKVIFDVNQADKLDVLIYKDGNECSFTQLSKGQRQLLKLTFGISVMQSVANHSGVKFNCLFFDEAMDGMSDTLKSKAYCLFQSLAIDYSSIFFVDHSESLKAIAEKSFLVTNENGESKIVEA